MTTKELQKLTKQIEELRLKIERIFDEAIEKIINVKLDD